MMRAVEGRPRKRRGRVEEHRRRLDDQHGWKLSLKPRAAAARASRASLGYARELGERQEVSINTGPNASAVPPELPAEPPHRSRPCPPFLGARQNIHAGERAPPYGASET